MNEEENPAQKANASAATVIQRYLADLPNDSFVETVADAAGDGGVSIIDAAYIQRLLAELPSYEGSENQCNNHYDYSA